MITVFPHRDTASREDSAEYQCVIPTLSLPKGRNLLRSRVFDNGRTSGSRFLTLRVRNDTSRAAKILEAIRFLHFA